MLKGANNGDAGNEPIAHVTALRALLDFICTLVASTTTDSEGRIAFENLPRPAMYTIKGVTPGGFVDVGDSDGGDPNIISVPVTTRDSVVGHAFVDERGSNAPSVSAMPSTSQNGSPTGSAIPNTSPSTGPSVSTGPSAAGVGSISGKV